MNLARFGLLKNSEGAMEPEGGIELVEITEREAMNAPYRGISKFESKEELLGRAQTLGAILTTSFNSQLYSNTVSRSASTPTSSLAQFEPNFTPVDMTMSVTPIRPKKKRKYVKHVKKTSKKFVAKTKKKLGILDFGKPVISTFKKGDDRGIRFHLSADEVLELFPKKNNADKLDKNLFARNVVWQLYLLAKTDPPEFMKKGCNMRTIFYLFKPTLTNSGIFTDDSEKTKKQKKKDDGDIDSFYGNFTRAVQKLVLEGLISYRDLYIDDDRKPFRFLPPARFNTHILLLAEKKAYVGRFMTLASRYGVMSQITRGRSTYLMTDTMLTEMFDLGYDFSKNLNILSFCDFDPVGTSIPIHFVKHLAKLGFHNVNHFAQYGDLIHKFETDDKDENDDPIYEDVPQIRPSLDIVNPLEFDAKTRRRMRHKLKSNLRNDPSTKKWSLATGGVTGTGKNTTYAISAEQFIPYIEEELEKKITPLLSVPEEMVGLSSRLRLLTRELQRHIGIRAYQKAKGIRD